MYKRLCVAIVAAGALAGCGSQSSAIGAGAFPQTKTIVEHLARGRSWMLPGASSQDLVYVSDQGMYYNTGVYVYSYPQGKQVGFLQPDLAETYEGLCSDSHGNVWVVGWTTNYQAFYDEYSHGGTYPIKGLGGRGVPSGCSLDPSTGNLAIANYQDFDISGHRGDVAIYKNATGSPQDYYDSSITYYYFCSYDNKGNLFADGDKDYINEIARNGATLRHIYFNKAITPGSLQWNNGSLAVAVVGGAKGPIHIDRVTVKGSNAQIVGTTSLQTYRNEGQYLDVEFWIQGKVIAGPGPGYGGTTRELDFWPYRLGGKISKTITAPNNSNFYGVAFSAAAQERGR
jgi:hypothetical protein